jgi:ABC-type amino acid transport substrate-binding protein
LVEEALRSLGHSVEVVHLPPKRAEYMIENGEIDAVAFRLANFGETVPSAIPIKASLATRNLYALVSSDSSFSRNEELIGKRIAQVRGVTLHRTIADQYKAIATTQQDFESAIKFIEAGRAEFTVVTGDIALQFINQGSAVKILESPVHSTPFYAWVSYKNADIVPEFQEALNTLLIEYHKEKGIQ